MKHLLYIALICAGCSSVPMPVCHYRVEAPFDIYVGDLEWVREQYILNGGDKRKVEGFCNMKTRTIFVTRDMHNEAIPDLLDLGHELWHLPELGGRWHE